MYSADHLTTTSKSHQTRVPFATILMSVAAIAIWLAPGTTVVMHYDRLAIGAGEWWRFFSCHWTHFSVSHLFWDTGAFAILGAICELRNRTKFLTCVLGSSVLISIAVWIFAPQVQTYRGLSGIDSALFVLLAVDVLRSEAIRGGRIHIVAGAGLLLILFMLKTVLEVVGGKTIFIDGAAAGMVPLPLAHLVGAVVGAICAMGIPRRFFQSRQSCKTAINGTLARILKCKIGPVVFCVILLPLLSGCEAFAYTCQYHGILQNADGSPAKNVKVAVLAYEPFVYYSDGHPIDIRDDKHTTSDAKGEFRGSTFAGTYVSWVGLPDPPPPVLNSVCLWYFQSGEWSAISMPLTKAQQSKTDHSKRYLELGAVRLPIMTTPPGD